MNSVLVFKTSVRHEQDILQLRPLLDQLIYPGDRWNFDLEDCDNILRVESRILPPGVISSLLSQHGFYCAELE